jgi:flagellar assembly protein FliH
MKSSPEIIRFTAPLRDVRINGARRANPRPVEPEPPPPDEDALRAAYDRGRVDGEKSLSEQLLHQRGEMRTLLDGVVASLRKAISQVVGDTEQHLVALAIEIAQKIVADLPISPEMIEASVREALSQVEGTAEFHVRLHPADLELLEKVGSALLQPPGEDRPARFHGSPEVTRGGCLVQTRFGIVDARRETKLELLKRSLLG